MNAMLYIGPHGRAPFGLVIIFLSMWAISYIYGTWKQREKMAFKNGIDKADSSCWNQRIFLLIVGLIGLFLPLIKSLFEQNIAGSGGFEKSFEAYSKQAVWNLILFFLFPFLISAVIMAIRKEFPTRVFNNLVVIMVVLVFIVFISNHFINS